MGGIFGGFVDVLDVIGGGILWLLIGQVAWGVRAQLLRVVLGGGVLGYIAGLLCFWYLPGTEYWEYSKGTICFILIPFISSIFGAILLALKHNLDSGG